MAINNSTGRTSTALSHLKSAKKLSKNKVKDNNRDVLLGEYSRYQVKSGLLSGKFVARAFLKFPTKMRSLVAEAKGETEEAAIAALHEIIDSRNARREKERRTAAQTGAVVPSTEEFVEAIGQVALSRSQTAMLVALALADGDGMTERRMASASGLKTQSSANRSFARVGLLIANYLSVEAVLGGPSDVVEGTSVLGFRSEPHTVDNPGNWILHPELRDAVRLAL